MLLNRLWPLTLALLLALPTSAATDKDAYKEEGGSSGSAPQVVVKATKTTEEPTKPWTIVLAAEHYTGFRPDNRPYTQFIFDGRYKLGKKHRLRLIQYASQKYSVASVGEEQFGLEDSLIYYYYTLKENFYGFKITPRVGFTLPLSKMFRQGNQITRPSVAMGISRKFFDDKLSLLYLPYVYFYWNRYTSTVGGSPLDRWSLGNAIRADYNITDKFTVTVVGTAAYSWKEPSRPVPNAQRRGNGSYVLDAALGYGFYKDFTVTLGYAYGDSYYKNGSAHFHLFDEAKSQFYVGLEVEL